MNELTLNTLDGGGPGFSTFEESWPTYQILQKPPVVRTHCWCTLGLSKESQCGMTLQQNELLLVMATFFLPEQTLAYNTPAGLWGVQAQAPASSRAGRSQLCPCWSSLALSWPGYLAGPGTGQGLGLGLGPPSAPPTPKTPQGTLRPRCHLPTPLP